MGLGGLRLFQGAGALGFEVSRRLVSGLGV